MSDLTCAQLAHRTTGRSGPRGRGTRLQERYGSGGATKYPQHEPTQDCAGCRYYQGKANSEWAPCTIFQGKGSVHSKGWCAAYAAK
jgi:hypothetical protein